MSWIGSEPHTLESRRLREYRLNTRPGATPWVEYSKYSPVPLSNRSSQKNDSIASLVIPAGSAVLVNDDEQPWPKNRLPFDDTLMNAVFAPKPTKVKPSGMLKKQLSSPRTSVCTQAERS